MPDGSTDNSFAIGSGADEHVNVVVRQPDGKYIIGGDFIQFNGQTKNRLARLNADGAYSMLPSIPAQALTVRCMLFACNPMEKF